MWRACVCVAHTLSVKLQSERPTYSAGRCVVHTNLPSLPPCAEFSGNSLFRAAWKNPSQNPFCLHVPSEHQSSTRQRYFRAGVPGLPEHIRPLQQEVNYLYLAP